MSGSVQGSLDSVSEVQGVFSNRDSPYNSRGEGDQGQ